VRGPEWFIGVMEEILTPSLFHYICFDPFIWITLGITAIFPLRVLIVEKICDRHVGLRSIFGVGTEVLLRLFEL
jgi:hypothetical protein